MHYIVAVIRSWGLARQGIGGQPGVVHMSMPSLEGITCDEFSPTVCNEALHVIHNEVGLYLIPTASLECVAKICPCKIAGLRSQACRASGFLHVRNPLC